MSNEYVVRIPLANFARNQEHRLRQFDHKGGWDGDSNVVLLDRAAAKLEYLRSNYDTLTPEERQNAALDFSNYGMMVFDNSVNERS